MVDLPDKKKLRSPEDLPRVVRTLDAFIRW